MLTPFRTELSRKPIITVPYVPTPEPIVIEMLKLAKTTSSDVVYDLGCGDGRIPIIAATKFKVKKAVGIEIRKDLVKEALRKVKELGLSSKVQIINADMVDVNIRDATVITLFLLTSANEKLKPKLETELRPGTRIVSHEFEIPGWKPVQIIDVWDNNIRHKLYLYIIGEHK